MGNIRCPAPNAPGPHRPLRSSSPQRRHRAHRRRSKANHRRAIMGGAPGKPLALAACSAAPVPSSARASLSASASDHNDMVVLSTGCKPLPKQLKAHLPALPTGLPLHGFSRATGLAIAQAPHATHASSAASSISPTASRCPRGSSRMALSQALIPGHSSPPLLRTLASENAMAVQATHRHTPWTLVHLCGLPCSLAAAWARPS